MRKDSIDILPPSRGGGKGPRILAVRLTALGDVANTFPAARGLKEAMPHAQISWVVEEGAAGLVKINLDVNDVLVLPRRVWQSMLLSPPYMAALPFHVSDFLREIRSRRFDIMLDFQGTLKSGLLGALCGIPNRIGFAPPDGREYNHIFLTRKVKLANGRILRAEKALALVRAIAPDADNLTARLAPDAEDCRRVAEFIGSLGLGNAPLIAMHPGTSDFGRFKRWPVDRFAVVAQGLAERYRTRPVITWGPGENEMAGRMADISGGAAVAAPPFTIAQLAAFLMRCALFIAADTGPLHVAAVLGRPTVAIFGPKDPAIYGPWGEGHAVVRKEMACSPCSGRICRNVNCLMDIEPASVLDAARGIIECKSGAY